jgi:histidinol-phosphate aminotransferase
MSRFSDLVSNAAREIGSYSPDSTKQAEPAETPPRLIKLDSNENPFGPSQRAIEAMRAELSGVHTYPDNDSNALRSKLAAHHALQAEEVLVTAGSTGLISLLSRTMLGPGLNAVTSQRSFIVYSMAVKAVGAQLIEAPMRGDEFDLAAILAAINNDTRVVFLANPNNPTGTMLEAGAVDEFLAKVPGHVVVALDEAYYEFASHFAEMRKVEYPKSLDYVRQGAAVVVLRTFSKVHGLAGLRIGYGLGPAELLGYCARMDDAYSVSSVGQAAALAAVDDRDHIAKTVSNNSAQAQIVVQGLTELGYRTVPTWANFVYCAVGEDAAGFAGRLCAEGISVRPLGAWGAASCVRVSIGTSEQNRVFLEGARRIGAGRTRH